jgi:hypothetical protein
LRLGQDRTSRLRGAVLPGTSYRHRASGPLSDTISSKKPLSHGFTLCVFLYLMNCHNFTFFISDGLSTSENKKDAKFSTALSTIILNRLKSEIHWCHTGVVPQIVDFLHSRSHLWLRLGENWCFSAFFCVFLPVDILWIRGGFNAIFLWYDSVINLLVWWWS